MMHKLYSTMTEINCVIQSLVPMLSPFSSGMAILTTEETQFDPSLCVTDLATILKPSETKKLCVDVTV